MRQHLVMRHQPAVAGEQLDDGWLRQLFVAHYRPMVRLAYLMTSSYAVAEELVQDCFLRIAGRSGDLDAPAAYLRTSVVNACRSWQRRERLARDRTPAAPPSVVEPELLELHDALSKIPTRQREALVLRYYEDLPEAEIARLLSCRPGTSPPTGRRR